MILLNDCPFCGADEVAVDYADKHIECEVCGAIVRFRDIDDVDALVKEWNERADNMEG